MIQVARTFGVAVLAGALLNASAGLCFCHRGLALPGESGTSGGCCHGPGSSGATVLTGASSCCHIESTESAATPAVAVQFAPPTAVATFAGEPSAIDAAPVVFAAALTGTSPPPLVLRI